jgi:predicted nucleic acid-binding protein
MSGFLVDTNLVSELVKPRPAKSVLDWVDQTDETLIFLSVLTLGEIRKGMQRLPAGSRRNQHEVWLEVGLRRRFAGRILVIDEAVSDRWGTIAAIASAHGKPVPVIDGLLAATALHHNLTLVTRNTSDVIGTGVRTLNPWL